VVFRGRCDECAAPAGPDLPPPPPNPQGATHA
jgi:hypothetical protein